MRKSFEPGSFNEKSTTWELFCVLNIMQKFLSISNIHLTSFDFESDRKMNDAQLRSDKYLLNRINTKRSLNKRINSK